MARLLIVEDKASFRALLVKLLSPPQQPHQVDAVGDAEAAADCLDRQAYDLVLTDVRLPGADGFSVLARCAQSPGAPEVVMMTAFATIDAAVAAVKAGAYDYLAKPFEPDDLVLTIDRALERRALRRRADAAEAALQRLQAPGDMLGDSPPMREVRRLIDRVAGLDVTVLVTGESGTGKEVVARAIHRASHRARGPFVAVNCGAIPANLIESELFGHARGAFTGAANARAGLFDEAAGGTLLLDEIGELPADLQVKLNRVLQERTCRRVGESRERPVDVRVVAATHRPLEHLIADGRFREDLYFRLAVYPIELPPLRRRGDDVLLLARHFLDAAAARFGRPCAGFSPEVVRQLCAHPWPGNVRQLRNVVERALILSETETVCELELAPSAPGMTPSRSPEAFRFAPGATFREAIDAARDQATRQYLHALLVRTEGNVTRAAEQAGIERESLHRLLRRVELDADDYRPA
jgi:two-component system response regulator HydG